MTREELYHAMINSTKVEYLSPRTNRHKKGTVVCAGHPRSKVIDLKSQPHWIFNCDIRRLKD